MFCAAAPAGAQQQQQQPAIHYEAVLADTHNDVISSALMRGLHLEDDLRGRAHTDLARLREGGVDVQVFSVWCGAKYTREGGFARALAEIGVLEETVRRNASEMQLVTDAEMLGNALEQGKLAAIIGVEGGHMIEERLDYLDSLYARGARYLTLTWNNSTSWATSAQDEVLHAASLHHRGLSAFGRAVVRRMNELGMMVDLSHTGDSTFWDAMQVTTRPVILSHSSAYAICPHYRNLKDDQIRAVAAGGGVICVNFYSAYLDPAYSRKVRALAGKYPAEADSLSGIYESAYTIGAKILGMHPEEAFRLRAPLSLLIDHIDHLVRVAGIDHVGIGSDFDGVGSLPEGIDDVSDYPKITAELLKRGYSEADIRKILGGNFLRVFRANTGDPE